MTLETDIVCLKSLPLFRSLPKPRLKLVALMGEKLWFRPGEAIVSEGDEPEGVYVVLSGDVEIAAEHGSGGSGRFQLTTGTVLGDVPILSGGRFAGTVTARSEVTALRLPKDLFFELLETVPDFSMALMRDLATRLYRLADAVLHRDAVHSGDREPFRH